MSAAAPETLDVVVEREVSFPPEKIWRALTQPHLLAEWLMPCDFRPVVGHGFDMRADWGVVACEVRTVEPNRTLSYTWNSGELQSTVTWTLRPTATGTHLRMAQSGFRRDQPRFYSGAKVGWPRYLETLEHVLARLD